MTTHIALLRGINVGGNTVLPMSELTSLCVNLGFKNVRTYIQSGNVIFKSDLLEEMLVMQLDLALQETKQKHIPVVMRTHGELVSVISRNPFSKAQPAQVGAMFFTEPVPKNILKSIHIPGPEEVAVSGREIYIHSPNGMGRSKLKLSDMPHKGTVRNINTVTKLAELSSEPIH